MNTARNYIEEVFIDGGIQLVNTELLGAADTAPSSPLAGASVRGSKGMKSPRQLPKNEEGKGGAPPSPSSFGRSGNCIEQDTSDSYVSGGKARDEFADVTAGEKEERTVNVLSPGLTNIAGFIERMKWVCVIVYLSADLNTIAGKLRCCSCGVKPTYTKSKMFVCWEAPCLNSQFHNGLALRLHNYTSRNLPTD